MSAVDVEPQVVLLRKRGQHLQIVKRPCRSRAGIANHCDDFHSLVNRFCVRFLQRFWVDLMVAKGANLHGTRRAPTHDANRPVHAVVRLLADQDRARCCGSILPRIARSFALASGEQGGQVGQRAAVAQNAAGSAPQAHESGKLLHHRLFHGAACRSHFINGHAVIEQCRCSL